MNGHRHLRVVRHRSEFGVWESVFTEPTTSLRPLVVGDYQGWIEAAISSVGRREIPHPGIVLILNFGPGFSVTPPHDLTRASVYQSFVAGLHDSHVLVRSTGRSQCIQVNLTPLGAYQVLGMPMDRITNRTVELEDAVGIEARRLTEQLAEARDWATRFDIVDRFLEARLARHDPVRPEVSWAWRQLEQNGGQVAVEALLKKLSWSRKRLAAQFKEQIGIPPKLAARIFRFHRAANLALDSHRTGWTEIAHRAGYYDQAHFVREFREFSGSTPTEFLSRQIPDGGLRGD
jgi:AraC-like DNA-binding protein